MRIGQPGSLSVGIPAYNQGAFLRAALISLFDQAVPPMEIVVSDNHSTDDTAQVLVEFAPRVRVIRPPRHLPMAAHWNFLVSNLHTDWFSLLSSDDVARPNFVAALQAAVSAHPEAVLVRGAWEVIDADGNLRDRHFQLSVRRVTPPPATLKEQLRGPKASFAAFACRRQAWADVGGFPESLGLFGDWGLWLRLSPFGQFIYVPDLISQYRVYDPPRSQSPTLLAQALEDHLEIVTEILPPVLEEFTNIDRQAAFREATNALMARFRDTRACLDPAREMEIAKAITVRLRRSGSPVRADDLYIDSEARPSVRIVRSFVRRALRQAYQLVRKHR